jgi:predicted nucleotidyltransferase
LRPRIGKQFTYTVLTFSFVFSDEGIVFMSNQKYLDITKDIVLGIIDKNNTTVFLFGSRSDGSSRFNSDIDIGLLSNIPIEEKILIRIREALDDSIVPFSIDLVDFNKCDKRFREIALGKIELWNNAKNSIINY